MARILLVDDDEALLAVLQLAFGEAGHEVIVARDGREGLTLAERHSPALLVTDVNMPKLDGFALVKTLRERGHGLPILVLTARDDEIDEALGLELGADDYVSKPFSLRELLARVKAMLRRRERPQAAGVQQFTLGGAKVDLAAFTVVVGGVLYTLSPKEAGMLSLLRQHGGRAVSRALFLKEVWGEIGRAHV